MVYSELEEWQNEYPHEVDIWKGDCLVSDIGSELSGNLEIWQKWKAERDLENKIIERAKPHIDILEALIDIDAISWGFDQFLHERKVDSLMKIIRKWKEDNLNHIHQFNSNDRNVWLEHSFFHEKAIEEYKQIMNRCLRYPQSTEKESFLGKAIEPQDVQEFLKLRQKNLLENSNSYEYKFNLDDIHKFEVWVRTNHFLDWDKWARLNMNWEKYLRNGYSNMYQEVWWHKNQSEKKYWECEDLAIPMGYNFNPEFKRRLIIKKLKSLNYCIENLCIDIS